MEPVAGKVQHFKVMLLVIASVVVSLSGCAGDPNAPKINPAEQATISGTVKFEGNPIPVDSGIYFSSREIGTTGGGKIDALGNFTIKAADPKHGLKAGRYHVTARPPGPAAVNASKDSKEYENMMANNSKKVLKLGNQESESPLIPKKFMLIDTTPRVLEVKPGPNKFDIDLAKIK